jgi:hypothetical protein
MSPPRVRRLNKPQASRLLDPSFEACPVQPDEKNPSAAFVNCPLRFVNDLPRFVVRSLRERTITQG